mmetsp:Transcript_24857/g.74690  ORF Transcript_24857/g.74690 Transcript_24857/m.74690 type:complete len:297 (+) Transcript_24857:122-1012(+)
MLLPSFVFELLRVHPLVDEGDVRQKQRLGLASVLALPDPEASEEGAAIAVPLQPLARRAHLRKRKGADARLVHGLEGELHGAEVCLAPVLEGAQELCRPGVPLPERDRAGDILVQLAPRGAPVPVEADLAASVLELAPADLVVAVLVQQRAPSLQGLRVQSLHPCHEVGQRARIWRHDKPLRGLPSVEPPEVGQGQEATTVQIQTRHQRASDVELEAQLLQGLRHGAAHHFLFGHPIAVLLLTLPHLDNLGQVPHGVAGAVLLLRPGPEPGHFLRARGADLLHRDRAVAILVKPLP